MVFICNHVVKQTPISGEAMNVSYDLCDVITINLCGIMGNAEGV